MNRDDIGRAGDRVVHVPERIRDALEAKGLKVDVVECDLMWDPRKVVVTLAEIPKVKRVKVVKEADKVLKVLDDDLHVQWAKDEDFFEIVTFADVTIHIDKKHANSLIGILSSILAEGKRRVHWAITNPGLADHYRHSTRCALRAVGLSEDVDCSPASLEDRICRMRSDLDQVKAANVNLLGHLEQIESQTLGLFAPHGVPTPAGGFRAAGWGWLRRAIQDLGGKVEKAQAERDTYKHRWMAVSDRAEASEHRADDYQQRFESLRRDVADTEKWWRRLGVEASWARAALRNILDLHPMPERAATKPGPQYPRATCDECGGGGRSGAAHLPNEMPPPCPACMKPRPQYVPESAPFCWSVDGLGDEVAMWVECEKVSIFDPDSPSYPWVWVAPREFFDSEESPYRLSARLWDDCDGFWRKVRGE